MLRTSLPYCALIDTFDRKVCSLLMCVSLSFCACVEKLKNHQNNAQKVKSEALKGNCSLTSKLKAFERLQGSISLSNIHLATDPKEIERKFSLIKFCRIFIHSFSQCYRNIITRKHFSLINS